MKAQEFCYWLQGYFELSAAQNGEAGLGTARAMACVRAHLDLVRRCDPDHDCMFVAWLDAELTAHGTVEGAVVRRRLANQFQHVIDLQHGSARDERQRAHDAWLREGGDDDGDDGNSPSSTGQRTC